MDSRSWICLFAVIAAATTGVFADHVVWFEDGRSMRVDRVERRDGVAVLILDGGGRMEVPNRRVVNWIELAEEVVAQASGASAADALWHEVAGEYAFLIERAAERHGVDPVLLTSMALVESAFDPRAVSPKGARGLLQLMPETAARFGVSDVFDVEQNLEGGARYLSWLLARYGETDLALAGYNAGEGAVDRYGGIPPYKETRNYVDKVLEGMGRLIARAGDSH